MERLGEDSFENNEAIATVKLTQLLDMRKDVLASIDEEGVHIREDELTVALDFNQALTQFKIWGLP